MKHNNITLNILKSCLQNNGFELKLYYDRIKLYVNSANDKTKVRDVRANKKLYKVLPRALPHYDTMNLLIDAYQPDSNLFEKLDTALTGDYVINYVEFAMDILSVNNKQLLKLRKLFNDLLIQDRKRCTPRFYHKELNRTHYYGCRKKHKDILVVYGPKEHKLDKNIQCVHIERRLYGSKIIKNFGIYTIQDLIDFQHETVWNKFLDLRDINYNKLGRLTTEDNDSLVDSTYWRNGKKMFEGYCSAQALLNKRPHCIQAFTPITNRRMFEARLKSALK